MEILFARFVIGLAALTAACPHRLKVTERKREIVFVLAGLTGVCLYFLLENIALTYTFASNVGVIVSVTPFFIAILSYLTMRGDERLSLNFFIGFIVAMAGVCLISFNGAALRLNPLGDVLAMMAALVWAFYSLCIRKIGNYGYSSIQATRRIFFYGVLFMIPALFLFGFRLDSARFAKPVNLFNILFLGLGASALCFATWSFAVKVLGPVRTSVYIYMTPVVTVVTSMIVLHEKITTMSGIGAILALAGLVISEGRFRFRN